MLRLVHAYSSRNLLQLSDFFEKIEGAKAELAVSDYSISQVRGLDDCHEWCSANV